MIWRPPLADTLGLLVGMKWPEGNEDLMWALADDWSGAAKSLDGINQEIDDAISAVRAAYPQGAGGEEMVRQLQRMRRGEGSVDDLVQWFKAVADTANQTGNEIEYAKIMFDATLAMMAIEMAIAAASLWAAAAEEAMVIASNRVTVRIIMNMLRNRLTQQGLRNAAMSGLRSQFTKKLALHVAFDAGVNAGLDAGIQGYQRIWGRRGEFRLDQTLFSGLSGGAGSLAGSLVGKNALKPMTKMLGDNSFVKRFAADRMAGMAGGGANALTAWAANGAMTGNFAFDPRMLSAGMIPGGLHGTGAGGHSKTPAGPKGGEGPHSDGSAPIPGAHDGASAGHDTANGDTGSSGAPTHPTQADHAPTDPGGADNRAGLEGSSGERSPNNGAPVYGGSAGERPTHGSTGDEQPVHDGSSGEHPAQNGSGGEHPVREGSPGEHPVHEGSSGEQLVHDGSPGEHPVHDGSPGERPVHDGVPGERPVSDGSGGEHPMRDGSPGERPVSDGVGGERPAHDGVGGERPVHDDSVTERPVHDGPAEESPVSDRVPTGDENAGGRTELDGVPESSPEDTGAHQVPQGTESHPGATESRPAADASVGHTPADRLADSPDTHPDADPARPDAEHAAARGDSPAVIPTDSGTPAAAGRGGETGVGPRTENAPGTEPKPNTNTTAARPDSKLPASGRTGSTDPARPAATSRAGLPTTGDQTRPTTPIRGRGAEGETTPHVGDSTESGHPRFEETRSHPEPPEHQGSTRAESTPPAPHDREASSPDPRTEGPPHRSHDEEPPSRRPHDEETPSRRVPGDDSPSRRPHDEEPSQHGRRDDEDSPHDRPDPHEAGPSETRPSIEEAHARHGEETAAGISHHRGDASMGDLPHRVTPDHRYFTADVHVTENGHARIGDHEYTPEEYGDLLRNHGWDGKTPIRLIGCDAATNGFARRLATHLGTDVLAPTKSAWSDTKGRVYSSTPEIGPDGNRRPRIPPDGEWETHRPNGTKSKAGDDGFVPGTRDEDKHGLGHDDAVSRGMPNQPHTPNFQQVGVNDPSIQDLLGKQRRVRVAARIGWKTMGGGIEYSIGNQSGTFVGFSGTDDVTRNAPRGTVLPPVAPPASTNNVVPNPLPPAGFRRNDAENNMLEHLYDRLQQRYPVGPNGTNPVSGHLTLFSEQTPCPSCWPTIDRFQQIYPNVKIDVRYVTPYPPIDRNRPTLPP